MNRIKIATLSIVLASCVVTEDEIKEVEKLIERAIIKKIPMNIKVIIEITFYKNIIFFSKKFM